MPAYGDAKATAGGSGGASETSAETTGTSGNATASSDSSVETTTGATTGTSETSGSESSAGPSACELEPGADCDAYAQDCPDPDVCSPYDPDGSGFPISTQCFPAGGRAEGEACRQACDGHETRVCQATLLCDIPPGMDEGLCRVPCTPNGPFVVCDVGLCFQIGVADAGAGYGMCRGECNPFDAEEQCGKAGDCVVDSVDGVPRCADVKTVVSHAADCSEAPCAERQVCVDGGLLDGCEADRCCATLCDPPNLCDGKPCDPPTICKNGSTCVALTEPHGLVDLGYCPLL